MNPKLAFPKTGKSFKTPLWIMAFAMLALVLSACGDESVPSGNQATQQLLINEVFTGSKAGGLQWIELLNNTNDTLPLAGYSLVTTHGTLDLAALAAGSSYSKGLTTGSTMLISNNPTTIQTQTYNLQKDNAKDDTTAAGVKRVPLGIEDHTVLGQLSPDGDIVVLVLKSATSATQGGVIDQVGWGTLDTQTLGSTLGLSTTADLNEPAPKGDTISLGRTPYVNQRDPKNPGPIIPGVFTIHSTPSPGATGTPRSKDSYQFIFATFTDVVTTLGAALLWLAFFFIALVAQRFETLSEQKTYWQWLAVAPAGILIYAIIQVEQFFVNGSLSDFWSWPAFLFLFISGVACVYVINIFRLIAKNILQAE